VYTHTCIDKTAKVARRVILGLDKKEHKAYWPAIRAQRQAEGVLKRPSVRRSGELLHLSRSQLRIVKGLPTGLCHLKGHLFKLGC
jgi:hypothetical protein